LERKSGGRDRRVASTAKCQMRARA
jgi:hypothetical protein